MTEQPGPWTATGVYWSRNRPTLNAIDPTGVEHAWPLALGDRIGVEITGPRVCVGAWQPGHGRRRCPFTAPIDARASSAQCPACAAADPGRLLARDMLVDDGRTYRLYLALSGPGLPKVGLTAAERHGARLAEQGALAYTWLAAADLTLIRAMEKTISASGIAAERHLRRTKLTAWRTRTDPGDRDAELQATYTRLTETVPWPDTLDRAPYRVIDLGTDFGLTDLPRTQITEVTAMEPGTRVAGSIRCLIGRELVLDTDDGPALLDTRLFVGCPIRRCTAAITGAETSPVDLGPNPHGHPDQLDQTALF